MGHIIVSAQELRIEVVGNVRWFEVIPFELITEHAGDTYSIKMHWVPFKPELVIVASCMLPVDDPS